MLRICYTTSRLNFDKDEKMKTEKEKQLQYEFGKKYSEYSKNRGWEDRIFIKVLMKDVSTILFESTMHDSNIPIDTTDLENIEKLTLTYKTLI